MKFGGEDHIEFSGKPFYLLGLVRGHWKREAEADFSEDGLGESEAAQLNTGIAIVTPITELLAIFGKERFVAYKEQMETKFAKDDDQVEDFAAEAESSEFENFKDLTRKLVQVPKAEIDKKRNDGD
jgi:hypothetical protein